MPNQQKPAVSEPSLPWYRVPLIWFSIGILLAVIAGSVHMIIISSGLDEEIQLAPDEGGMFKVPSSGAGPTPASGETERKPGS